MQKIWEVPIDIAKREIVWKTRLANRNTTLRTNLMMFLNWDQIKKKEKN